MVAHLTVGSPLMPRQRATVVQVRVRVRARVRRDWSRGSFADRMLTTLLALHPQAARRLSLAALQDLTGIASLTGTRIAAEYFTTARLGLLRPLYVTTADDGTRRRLTKAEFYRTVVGRLQLEASTASGRLVDPWSGCIGPLGRIQIFYSGTARLKRMLASNRSAGSHLPRPQARQRAARGRRTRSKSPRDA